MLGQLAQSFFSGKRQVTGHLRATHRSPSAITFFMQNQMRKRIIAIFIALLTLVSLAGVGYMATEPTFTIYDGAEPIMVSGRLDTVGDVLAAAEISVRSKDIVQPGLTETAVPDIAIQIQRARSVTVRAESGTQTYWTRQTMLGAFLFEINHMPRRTDEVTADGVLIPFAALGDTPLPNMVIIGRFLTITIVNDNQQHIVQTAAQTVGAALQEAGITLYAAANDRALSVSKRFYGGIPRAGDVPAAGPLIVPGVDTIDATAVSMDSLGLHHSGYAESNALLQDIGLLIQTGERPPAKRVPILQEVTTDKGAYWRYPPPQ